MILINRIFGFLCVIAIGLSACAPVEPEGDGISKPVITPLTDVSVDEGLPVSLTVSATTEKGTIATYLWQQTSGIDVTLATPNQQSISFTAPEVDATNTLGFSVTVTNSEGESAIAEVSVEVSNVISTPVIAEIAEVAVDEGMPVSLTVNATTEKGSIATYLWLQTSGKDVTLATPNQQSMSFTAPEVDDTSTLGFSVTVTNSDGESATEEVSVIVVVINELSTRALNDTGVTLCGDYGYETLPHQHNNDADCSASVEVTHGLDPIPTGQDGQKGRDADLSFNQDHDGVAGFSFTKLEVIGGGSLASNASQWSCVRDNVTGLIWEVKQDSGLRSKDHTYTWYNSRGVNDGGSVGYSSAEFTSGSDTCEDSSRCDTEKFVEDVNNLAQPLCGYTDWRLPTLSELTSIVNFGSTTVIDSKFFPFTNYEIWSANPFANTRFTQHAWSINLSSGQDQVNSKKSLFAVRLVRSGD